MGSSKPIIVKIEARVVASLIPGTLDILVGHTSGHLNGGIMHRVSVDLFPVHCRMLNTLLWVTLENGEVCEVERV